MLEIKVKLGKVSLTKDDFQRNQIVNIDNNNIKY